MLTDLPPTTDLVMDLLTSRARTSMSSRALCKAGAFFDLPETSIRVALTRLGQQQKIVKVGRGEYAIHPSRQSLVADVADWRARLSWLTTWTGGWVAAVDPVLPAENRVANKHHHRALALRGFQAWRPGFHLRPDNLQGGVELLASQLPQLGLAQGAEIVGVQMSGRQAQDVVGLWDVGSLRSQYEASLTDLRQSMARWRSTPDPRAACESLLLGRTVIAHLVRDPLLPSEIMRGDARQELARTMSDYQDWSRGVWTALLDED